MAEKLQIVIDAKDQASPVLKGVAGTAKTSFASMAGPIKAHAGEIRAAGMATTAFGVATLAVAKGNIDAYRTQEVSHAKLSAAIKGTAQSIDQSRLEKLAADLQKVTTFGDEATIEMMALLTTFNLTQDQIESLAPRIQNISAIMGTDMQSAAIAVGKAISTANWGALTRFGIIIDEDTQKSGDFVEIMKAIDRNTGPAAEELAKGAGAAEQLANQFGDLREVAGEALIPVLKAGVAVLKPMVGIMQTMVETPLGKAFVIAATGAGLLMVPLGAMLMALPTAVRAWELLTGAQLRNAAAANTVAAANTRAGAAAVAGGAGAAAGGAASVAGGAAVGAGAGLGAGAIVGRLGIYGAAAMVAAGGAQYYFSKKQAAAEQQISDIESGATETPEQKALLGANMARWQKARGQYEQQSAAGIIPGAAEPTSAGIIPGAEAMPSLAAIPTEQMISDELTAAAQDPLLSTAAQDMATGVARETVAAFAEAMPEAVSSIAEQFAQGVAPDILKAQMKQMLASGALDVAQMDSREQLVFGWLPPKEQAEARTRQYPRKGAGGITDLGDGRFSLPASAPSASIARMRDLRSEQDAEWEQRQAEQTSLDAWYERSGRRDVVRKTGKAIPTSIEDQAAERMRSLPVAINAEGVDVSESYTDRGREVLIRVLIPETAPGILTDATDAYLEDFAYQGVG